MTWSTPCGTRGLSNLPLPMVRPVQHPKTGVYLVRKVVPPALRAAVGKTELKESLGTKDPRIARQLAPAVVQRFEAIIANARQGARPLTDREISALCGEWYRDTTAAYGDNVGTVGRWSDELSELSDRWVPDEAAEAKICHPWREDRAAARELLAAKGCAADAELVQRVAVRLLETKWLFAEAMRRRAAGDWSPDENLSRFPAMLGAGQPFAAEEPVAAPIDPARLSRRRSAAPLASSLEEPFFTRRKALEGTREQVMAQERSTLQRFVEVCGNRPVDAYHRGDVTTFLDTLRRLPKTYGKSPKDKGRPLSQIIAEADEKSVERLTDKTVKRHLSTLSGFFQYAVDRGHLSATSRAEMMQDHRFRAARGAREQRDAWTPDELKKLFASPVWTGCHPVRRSEAGPQIIRDAKFWLPLLALFHGARLEELADLYRRDVGRLDSIWFFDIRETERRTLKTAAATRRLPLHPELVRLGFLTYVATAAPNPNDPLFPDLAPQGRDKRRGPRITRWFVEYRKAIGLFRPGVSMHAFRHVAITRLSDAIETAQQKRHRDFIMGHAARGTEGDTRYDKAVGLRAAAETLALLRFPEVDLSQLYLA